MSVYSVTESKPEFHLSLLNILTPPLLFQSENIDETQRSILEELRTLTRIHGGILAEVRALSEQGESPCQSLTFDGGVSFETFNNTEIKIETLKLRLVLI